MQTLSELIPRFRSLGRREAIRHSTIYSSRVVTWNELYDLIGICVSFLDDQGLLPGDRVMIQAENCPEWVALFWACVGRGIHVVPIDFNFTPELASRIRADCGARLSVDAAVLEELRIRAGHSSVHDFSITPAAPDDIVEIIYTSGTTGEPHGIVHRHRNICANLGPFQREISRYRRWASPFQPIRILELLPLSHMFGQSMGLFVPIMLEGSVAFTSEIRPSAIVNIVHDSRISVLVSVPRILESLRLEVRRDIRDESAASAHLSGIPGVAERWLKYRKVHSRFGWKFWAFVAGGARVDPDLEEFWGRLGFAVIQGYGLTEASPVVAVNHPFSSRRGSLGKPVPGQEVRISEDGEILVRGESIAGAVDAEGWLHTGDLGEMDSDGRLYFRGRRKDVIVTPEGLNVSPDDVEEVLRQIPEIKDSAVVSIGEQVHAALILRNVDTSYEEIAQLVRQANERLETHQRIRNWSIWPLADFPRTASTLKVKRGVVADQLANGPARETTVEPDPSAMSSLERVELLTRLEERHGIDIDEEAFSRATTAADLKRFMNHPTEAQSPPPLPAWPLSRPVRAFRGVFQRCVAGPLFRRWLPLTITGLENLEGIAPPVLFAANHASDLDTPAVFTALPRMWRNRIAPAMRADYFGSSWKFRVQFLAARTLYNAFPLPQEMTGTRRAFEYTAELVRRGYCPLVFPEGRRTRDGRLQNFRPGIGMMAVRLRIPVVPICIGGMFQVYSREDSWPKAGPVHVSIGKPMRFAANTKFEDATQAIRDAVVELREAAEILRKDPSPNGRGVPHEK